MILDPAWIPLWLQVLMSLVATVGCLGAALTAPWRALFAVPARQHMLFGGTLALLLLRLGTIELADGLRVHLLGITSLTMIVGWRFAVLGASAVLLVQLLVSGLPLAAAPAAWLFGVGLPATISRGIVSALRRQGFRNLFAYLLGAGFGGGLTCVLGIAVTCLPFLWLVGQGALIAPAVAGAPLLPLLMFPEGFLNGMVVTAFTVFWPGVVKTFDDEHYLGS